jgi:hypothetical protein
VLGRGPRRHAEAVIGEHLTGAGDMAHNPVEDAPSASIAFHAELEEMAHKTPAPRDAKSERVADAGVLDPRPFGDQRVVRAVVVGAEAGSTGGAGLPLNNGRPAAGSSASAAVRRMLGRPACSPASG